MKSYYGGPIGSHKPSPTPYGSPSPRSGVRNSNPKCNRYYLMNGKSYELQIWPVHSQIPSEQKPMKNLGEKGAWAYAGTTHIFWVPPVISGMGKATNFKFCTHIHSRIDRNKSPLKISTKIAVGVLRTLASRGHLCDSSAFLFKGVARWDIRQCLND